MGLIITIASLTAGVSLILQLCFLVTKFLLGPDEIISVAHGQLLVDSIAMNLHNAFFKLLPMPIASTTCETSSALVAQQFGGIIATSGIGPEHGQGQGFPPCTHYGRTNHIYLLLAIVCRIPHREAQ